MENFEKENIKKLESRIIRMTENIRRCVTMLILTVGVLFFEPEPKKFFDVMIFLITFVLIIGICLFSNIKAKTKEELAELMQKEIEKNA